MPREKSIGAVIYNQGNYLLLHYTPGHWDFPKGHVEEGESEDKTIRREIMEETGIKDIFLVKNFKEQIAYFFKRDGQTVYKEVVYFLFESHTKVVVLSKEHTGYTWLPFHQAMQKLTFPKSKDILRKAYYFLDLARRI